MIKKQTIKHLFFCILLFFGLLSFSFAQLSTDPAHPIYTDIRTWEAQGLVSNLPLLRPYPMPVLKSILEKVIEAGTPKEIETAKEYYAELTGFPIHFVLKGDGTFKIHQSDGSDEKSVYGFLGGAGDISLLKMLSLSYQIGMTLYKNPQRLPSFIYPTGYDTTGDVINISSIEATYDANTVMAFGNESIYFQAGLSRANFGNFYDSSVSFGSQAFHTGNFNVVIAREKWQYTQSLFMLSGTNNLGGGSFPNKFLSQHSLTFYPLKWFNFTYYENMVYGGRFDPVYLIPFVPFMIAQGVVGYGDDNLQMGLLFQFSPASNLKWNIDIMVDDISLSDLVKLRINTKFRIAAQTGITWAPQNSVAKIVTVDYTMIVPYMYSHSQWLYDPYTNKPVFMKGDGVNYQNYTTFGLPLGSNLPPNSDRMNMKILFNPIKNLEFGFAGTFIRVANVNELLPIEYAKQYLEAAPNDFRTDGSVFDHYGDAEGNAKSNAQNKFEFMSQPTKMYVLQTDFDIAYTLPWKKFGKLTFKGGYTLEYIHNYGVQNNMYPGANKVNATDQDVADAIAAWKSALIPHVFNHYFRISAKYVY